MIVHERYSNPEKLAFYFYNEEKQPRLSKVASTVNLGQQNVVVGLIQ